MSIIPDSSEWQGVRDALTARGLDPSNPLHVLGLLKVAFPASGRPLKWDAERAWLAIEFQNARFEGRSAKTDFDLGTPDLEICDRLAATGRFGPSNGRSLLRQLQRFRNPKTNEFLRRRVEEYCAKNGGVDAKVARQHILNSWDFWDDAEGNFLPLPGGVDPRLVPQLALSRQDIEAFQEAQVAAHSKAAKPPSTFAAKRQK